MPLLPIISSRGFPPKKLRHQVRRQQKRGDEALNFDKPQSNEPNETEDDEYLNVEDINVSTVSATNPAEIKTNTSPTEKDKCENCDF